MEKGALVQGGDSVHQQDRRFAVGKHLPSHRVLDQVAQSTGAVGALDNELDGEPEGEVGSDPSRFHPAPNWLGD